jgi:hypothetical protein
MTHIMSDITDMRLMSHKFITETNFAWAKN